EIDGRRVDSDPVGIRARVGYMPEHDCLPADQSAADLVAGLGELSGLPARDARQRASDVLNLVGLDEARFRPMGGFSTGMKQRVKLAQAIVADPTLVLLDEPTAGLDPTGREEMLGLVARLGEFGISAVMATHLLDDVQKVCDHVVMLDGGRLVVAGPTESLLEAKTGAGGRAGAARLQFHLAGWPPRSRRRGRRRRHPRRHPRRGGRAAPPAHAPVDTGHLTRRRLRRQGQPPEGGAVMTVAATAPKGQVYDRGYRPYEGKRGGRGAVVRALWIASVRRALGLRRSWRQKLLPWGLLVVVSIPAIVAVGIAYVTRNTPGRDFHFISYQEYVGVSSALLLFVAVTAPDIMCPDRRQRV